MREQASAALFAAHGNAKDFDRAFPLYEPPVTKPRGITGRMGAFGKAQAARLKAMRSGRHPDRV